MGETYYDMLDVGRNASQEEIKRAYREQIKATHPDRNDASDAKERTMRLNEAKKVLTDPQSRAEYDRQIGSETTTSGQAQWSSQRTEQEQADAEQESRRQQRQRERERQQRQQRQHRQQRQQHQQRTKRQRRRDGQQNQRQQQRQRTQQRQQRQQRTTETRGQNQREQSRTRTGRQTRTRTRDRNRTASAERRDATAAERIREAVRVGRWRFRQAFYTITPPYSSPLTRERAGRVARSPTTIRLVAAFALMMMVTRLTAALGYEVAATPAGEFGIVFGSLLVSYVAYEVVEPLPFEEPRSQSRFKPAGRDRIWPALAANLLGIGLIVASAVTTTITGGVRFAVFSVLWAGTLGIFCSFGLLYMLGLFGSRLGPDQQRQGAKTGFALGPVVSGIVLFSKAGGGLALPKFFPTGKAEATLTPWVPQLVVGPIYLGTAVNFALAVLMIGCLLWSVVGMCRYLSAVPWSDRYRHGYRVRPGLWNFLLAAPLVILGWMSVMHIQRVEVGVGSMTLTLAQNTLWVGLFVLPSILTSAYILRRRAEPKLRETVWKQRT